MSDPQGIPIQFAVVDGDPRTDWPPLDPEDLALATHLFGTDFANELAKEFGAAPTFAAPQAQQAKEKSA